MQDFTENSDKGNLITYRSRPKPITVKQEFLAIVIFWCLRKLKANMDFDKTINKFHTYTQNQKAFSTYFHIKKIKTKLWKQEIVPVLHNILLSIHALEFSQEREESISCGLSKVIHVPTDTGLKRSYCIRALPLPQ